MNLQDNLIRREKMVTEMSKLIHWDKMALEHLKNTVKETDNELETMKKYMKIDQNIVKVSQFNLNSHSHSH